MLLKRKYKLIVGTPRVNIVKSKIVTEDEVIGADNIPKEGDYRTITLDAVEINDLDLQATINSTSSNGGNGATTLKILNLSPESLEVIEKDNNYVILEAGYSSDTELRVIFTGTVSSFKTERNGSDQETTLTCADGYIPNNTIRVSKTFPEDTKANTIFNYIIARYKNAGIPLGQFVEQTDPKDRVDYVQLLTPAETTFATGYSLNGWLVDELRDLCSSLGYVGYITNGRLFIHPTSFTSTTERYSYSTNQVFSVRKSSSNTSSSTSKADTGIDVSVQLDGRLGVDKQIEILDGDYKGVYKILSCSFVLGYRQGEWKTNVSCKRLDY